jgi:hypothetical protein
VRVLAAPVALLAVAAVTPAQLVSSSLKAARAQHSVHYVATATATGLSATTIGDAAADRGVQYVTYRAGGHVGHVTVRVVANTAYVKGDAFALSSYVGLSAAQVARYAGKWILIPHTASVFKSVAEAVRLDSTIAELQLSPPFTNVGTSTMQGQRVIGVRGRETQNGITATATLYVRAAGTPLPVAEVASEGQIHVSVVFGKWNERVSVTAPAGAVPLR